LLCASSAIGEQKLKKLRLAYDGVGVATTVAWVGNQAGLFKQQKVEVEEIFIQDPSIGGIQALLGVDIFFGSGNPVIAMQPIIGGQDIVFLGSHVDRTHYRFGVSSDIESIKQLKGKKVGMSRLGGRSDLIARVVLRRAGIDPVQEVEMVTIGYSPARAAALAKNFIQGAPLSPNVASEAEKLGLKVLDVKEVPIISSLLMTTRSNIKRDYESFRRFMKGYVTSIHYFLTHPSESIRIIGEHVSVADPAALETMYASYAAQLEPWPVPNPEAVQAIIDAATEIDRKARKLKADDLFDLRFLDELKAIGFIENLYAEKVKL
jgi:ABC-type nitrate/sulfonate/bicarbonate transport system substrate-binding protein